MCDTHRRFLQCLHDTSRLVAVWVSDVIADSPAPPLRDNFAPLIVAQLLGVKWELEFMDVVVPLMSVCRCKVFETDRFVKALLLGLLLLLIVLGNDKLK